MENQGRNNNPNYQHTFTLFFLSNERHNLCLLLIILFFFFSFCDMFYTMDMLFLLPLLYCFWTEEC